MKVGAYIEVSANRKFAFVWRVEKSSIFAMSAGMMSSSWRVSWSVIAEILLGKKKLGISRFTCSNPNDSGGVRSFVEKM
jgi:hypothetical protein